MPFLRKQYGNAFLAAVFSEPHQADSTAPRPKLVAEAFEAPHSAWWNGLRRGAPIAYACLVLVMAGVIVFVLFFEVLAAAFTVERGLKMRTGAAISPGAVSDGASKPVASLSITVSDSGTFALNGEATGDGIVQAVKRFAAQNQSKRIVVTVRAHPSAAYDRIIDALNALALASIKEVTFDVMDVN